MRRHAAVAWLVVVVGGGCGRVDTHFAGVVSDAATGGAVAFAQVRMEVSWCANKTGILCLEYRDRVTAGPLSTAEDGSFSFAVGSPDDIGSVLVTHGAYEPLSTGARDSKTKSTKNELRVSLRPRTPERPRVARSSQAGARLQIDLPAAADGLLVLRVDAGGVAGKPEARRAYSLGERLGQATVLHVAQAPLQTPATNTLTHVEDASAPAAASSAYVVHATTAVLLYSEGVSFTWAP